MNSPYIKDYNDFKGLNSLSLKQLNPKNKFNFSQSLTHARKNHCILNCKNPIKTKEAEFIIVKSLWNDLGVNIEFQNEFKNYYNELGNDKEKMELLINEKNHLRKFRECLIKLSEEISNRDESFLKLKKYCNELEKYQNIINSKNSIDDNSKKNINNIKEEIPFDLFDLIQKEINYYRINTVNAINKIMRVREISSYYELNKKWDPSNINRSYSFNKNYLLTMLKDIELINNSVLLNYIQTDNHILKTDLFFSNCKYLIVNENTKLKLSISLELQAEINKCKYILLQDKLLNNIQREFNKKININNIKRNIISAKQCPFQNTISNFSTLSKKVKSEIVLSNDKEEKKYYEMFGHNKVNLSRTLYYLKKTMGNKYQKMFYSENDLLNVQRNMDIMKNFVSLPQTVMDEDLETNIENKEEINIIDNNKNNIAIMEYSNKNKWNNHNMFNSESNSKNNRLEQINKNNEDLKLEKNIKYYFGKREIINNSINKKIKLKKKHKKEKSKSEGETENNKNIKDKNCKKEKIIINSEKKKKENKISNDKVENKEENKEKINSKKEEKVNKKFEIDNNKVENVININIIIEKKQKEENNINDINEEKKSENLEKEEEIKENKKEEENEVESYINISQDHSKFSEDKYISKIKLLEYKQFTEEEIQKFNKNLE